jgi:hypothetical protein
LLPENDIISRELDPRLRVLSPEVATRFKPTRIVQGSWFEIQEWKVALIVEPLMIEARSALGAEVATRASVQTLADKVIRLRPSYFNLEVLKNNGHRKGTPRLLLANRAMARPNESGAPHDFVPDCAALAPARIVVLHLSCPPQKLYAHTTTYKYLRRQYKAEARAG